MSTQQVDLSGPFRAIARGLGADQDQVVGRKQAYKAGVPRWLIRREIKVGRWQRGGTQSFVMHNGPLTMGAKRWIAVLEQGPRAALSGVTALMHDGVDALSDEMIHVIVPVGAKVRRMRGVVVHQSRRFREEDIVTKGIRRTKPAVSAVHAGLWAKTERQAIYFSVLVVNEKLCRPVDLANVLALVQRGRWRKAMLEVVGDLAGGVRSLGELDVARAMRRRGLPEPSRQVIRTRPSGKKYLDAEFEEYGIVMEVDGDQHDLPWMRLADAVRDIDAVTEGSAPIRIPLIAWRVDEERVLDALEALFRSRGWVPRAA